jgi:hypothetical protein
MTRCRHLSPVFTMMSPLLAAAAMRDALRVRV